MLFLANIIGAGGFIIYAMFFLVVGCNAISIKDLDVAKAKLDRLMSIGPILGLSLGACIFGLLAAILIDDGGFSWDAFTPYRVRVGSAFGLMWLSHIKFEIWTLDAVRDTEPDNSEPVSPSAIRTVHRHLWGHCLLIIAVLAVSLQT
jgi:hypothetical protein